MMSSQKARALQETARSIEEEIKAFVRTSPLNRIPMSDDAIFDEPLVQFADGDDPIFTEYKTIIDPTHLTPREALAKAVKPENMPAHLSVISWVLPITPKTRQSNRRQTQTPSRFWVYTRWHGEKFNDALREHVVKLLNEMGYRATAPMVQPYFKIDYDKIAARGYYSNWSERHIAYAAGLGTFSLSDGFITERGIAHRCGSVVTDLALPPSPRTAGSIHANCLFYVNGTCTACIARCPAGAITEDGHDKIKCLQHILSQRPSLAEKYDVGIAGCGLCQVKVPCEYRNPAKKVKRKVR